LEISRGFNELVAELFHGFDPVDEGWQFFTEPPHVKMFRT
jgi:hypothetical protein